MYPGTHLQNSLPAFETEFGWQGAQAAEPLPSLKVIAAHITQAVFGPVKPGLHWQSAIAVDAAGDELFPGHAMHAATEVALTNPEYRP